MKTTRLGSTGPRVAQLGLGCMGMSDLYGPADRGESIATIHAALDAGITLLDTGDFYGMGHNELLIGEALAGGRRDQAVVSVKFGALRGPDGAWLGYDARPQAVKNFAAYSLRRLGLDHIDIYRPARLDPNVPIEETVGAIAELVKAGYVRHIGLSEVSAATLRRASVTRMSGSKVAVLRSIKPSMEEAARMTQAVVAESSGLIRRLTPFSRASCTTSSSMGRLPEMTSRRTPF